MMMVGVGKTGLRASSHSGSSLVVMMMIAMMIMMAPTVLGLRLDGSDILDDDGNRISMKGFSWFGFNNGDGMLDGVGWSNDPVAGDLASTIWRQKLLGFNAVRLPFSFKDLELEPRPYTIGDCKPPSALEMAKSVTPPGRKARGPAPPLPSPPVYSNNECNGYLPSNSTRERFIWVAKFFAKNGFYVMVDNHLREDQTALEDEDKWSSAWGDLARDLTEDPDLKSRLILDILNEPDNYGLMWSDIDRLYTKAIEDIESKTDGNVVYALEGTGQSSMFVNWGDGFYSDSKERIDQLGMSDPIPFFDALMDKPYKTRVVLSPHVYPASVTFTYDNVTGAGLFYRMSASFGTKMTKGYCKGSTCQKFPVAIGEFGSKFEDEIDLVTMDDLAQYMSGKVEDGKSVDNWFYWSWNANSGDTGGIVDGSWLNINWKKVNYLKAIGLKPWSDDGDSVVDSAVLAPQPPADRLIPKINELPTVPESDIEAPTVEYLSPPPDSGAPLMDTNTMPTADAPSTEPQPPLPETIDKTGDNVDATFPCNVRVDMGSVWRDGAMFGSTLNIYVTSTGTNVYESPWELVLSGPAYNTMRQAWRWDASLDGTDIVGRGRNGMKIQPNSETYFGLVVSGPDQALMPTQAILNGQSCSIS